MSSDEFPSFQGVAGGPLLSDALPEPRETVSGVPRARLFGSLLVANLALLATLAGVIGVLLAQQVAELDPSQKVTNLAIVMTTGAFFTLFAQPIIGALSDRTRSRWGRRAPWIVIGGVSGGIMLIVLQFAPNLFSVTVLWVLAQVALNCYQAPLPAVIADRVAAHDRGSASAFMGVGVAVGSTVGILVAGLLISRLGVAYGIFGGAMIVVSLAFVLLNPDRPSTHLAVAPFRLGTFLRGFWISPRRHPDYAWAFGGKFLITLGYTGVQTYQLYILTDYLHLPIEQAGAFAGLLALCTMVTLSIGTLVFGRMSDRTGRRKVFVLVASAVIAVGVAIPLFVPTQAAMIAFALIIGIGYGAFIAVDAALMIDVLPSQGDIGRDLGVLNIAAALPGTLTPIIAATLLAIFGGNYASIFAFAAVLALLSGFCVLPIKAVR